MGPGPADRIAFGGAARRSYRFPAQPAEAFAFLGDVDRAIGFLAHIDVVSRLGRDRFRLVYAATEAGLYPVRIVCDVVSRADPVALTMSIRPAGSGDAGDAAPCVAGLTSMTGAGRYSSDIAFAPAGRHTLVTCSLSLEALLPRARSLRLLPRAVVEAGARRIVGRRIDEILDGFARQSIAAFERLRGAGPRAT